MILRSGRRQALPERLVHDDERGVMMCAGQHQVLLHFVELADLIVGSGFS
jgi:hypothetical protein